MIDFALGGRGRLHSPALRRAVLAAVARVVDGGGRRLDACRALGLSVRTVARWRARTVDQRTLRRPVMGHALKAKERSRIVRLLDSARYRGLSVRQVVPLLADRGIYVASEATLYRLLKGKRASSSQRAKANRPARSHRATRPRQVWSWDITRLDRRDHAEPFFLYVVLDAWSRKIVGWAIHERESATHAAVVVRQARRAERVTRRSGLVLHADNGAPMRAKGFLQKMRHLGVATSFCRVRAPNDNPLSEALFGTMKRRPSFPRRPFKSIEGASAWVAEFVRWYNGEHLHSALRYVTPNDRHERRDKEILARRRRVYEAARREHPRRWTKGLRNWNAVADVVLNPHGSRR